MLPFHLSPASSILSVRQVSLVLIPFADAACSRSHNGNVALALEQSSFTVTLFLPSTRLRGLLLVGLLSLEARTAFWFSSESSSAAVAEKKATSPGRVRLLKGNHSSANSCWPRTALMRFISSGLGGWPCFAASGVCVRNASGSHGAM